MIYVFDIDGTICTKGVFHDGNYEKCRPFKDRIKKINKLYNEGHTIVFQTARGMGRFENDSRKAIEAFYDLTYRQLNEWNVKFHSLFLGKPAGDIYIDDKGIKDEDFFENETRP